MALAEWFNLAVNGNLNGMRSLMGKGASFRVVDPNGWTPLHCAAMNGHTAIVLYEIDNGIVVDQTNMYDGRTPLHCAATNGHMDTVRYLVEAGANVFFKDNYGCTPMYYAQKNKKYEVADFLRHSEFYPALAEFTAKWAAKHFVPR
jgi:ankyrin repeat protein